MLPECLQNFIGITRDCNNMGLGASKSFLYLTDLEGLDIEVIADFVTNDATAQHLIERKIEFAINMVFEDLDLYIQPYFSFNKVIEKQSKGSWSTEIIPPEPLNRGLHIKKHLKGFLKYTVEKLKILCNNTVSTTLTIKDGIYTKTYPVDLVAGQIIEVFLDYNIIFDDCYITLDNTTLEMYKVNLHDHIHSGCYSCGHSESHKTHYLDVHGFDSLVDTTYTFGMSVELNTQCDFEVLRCTLAHRFKTLFYYRAGIELVKHWIHSPRVNETTILNIDHGHYLIQEWSSEYDKKFKVAVNSIRELMKSFSDICVICNQTGYYYQI